MIKKLLPLLLLILIGCSEPEPINGDMLIHRNKIYYTNDTNQPYSGPVFLLHKNGQLYSEGNLKNGKPTGTFKWYYKNGQLKSERNMKNGEPHGLSKYYNENGEPHSELNFKNGKVIYSKFY